VVFEAARNKARAIGEQRGRERVAGITGNLPIVEAGVKRKGSVDHPSPRKPVRLTSAMLRVMHRFDAAIALVDAHGREFSSETSGPGCCDWTAKI
jgi:hypothetical protein